MKAQRLTQRATSLLLVFLLLMSMATGVAAQSEVQTLSSDTVSLNYSDVAISLHSGYALPLYLTTEYFTEPSATGKVSWSSSDESVATVDADGRVHPVAVGVTTITARHADYPEQPVTCAVTVYQEAPCTTFYYLSPEGSDDNDGSEGSPFQTIEKARDTIRDLPELPVGGVTVILEDGKYPVTHTVEFAPEDSGTQANPIVYKARHQGKAILTGEVSIQGWQKAAVEVGMSETAQGNLFVANIEKGWRFHDLYLDGERQQVSRSQNTDNWRVWPKFYGRAPISYDAEKGTKVVFANGELDGLQGNEDVELVLLPVMYWNSIPLVKHIDPANRTAYLQSKIPSNFWPEQFGTEEGFYNIINTLKYLDEPGEWCVDSAAGKVYYWPKDEQVLGTASLVAPKLYELLRLQGDGVEENFARLVEYITFDGISFQYTDRLPENEFPDDWIIRNAENPDAAVYFDGTQHCRLINGEVTRSGSYGVMINHYGQQNEVINNRLHDLGSGGVQIFGYGVGTVDVSYLNRVMYNTIYNMGVAPYQHSPGIGIFGSGRNTLAYNYIAGAPYAGISIVGTDENSVSATKPNVRAAYDLYGDQARQYGIRFEDLEALPAMERDGVNGEYFTIGTLAEKYQHSSRNVAEYNILDDYSQSMDDGGALYSWYCGLGNVYAYNVLKEELQGSRTWVFRLYMDDRALGFTLQNNQSTGNFGGTIDKSFAPYKNRWVNNGHAKFPLLPEGYTEQRTKILNHVQETVGGFNLPETVTPVILTPQNGDQNVSIPTSFTWQRCENAALYTLEIATDEAFANIVASLQTKDTIATTDLLEYGTSYFGRLRTRELLQPGQVSEVISFKTGLQPPPTSAPRDMKVSNDIDAVLIQWTPVPKTTVNVYRKADGEDHYSLLVGNIPGTGYLDSSVVEKKRYSYIISAANNSGEGPMSESADITTRELEVLFRDNFDDGKISDLWTDLQGKQANLNEADGKVIDGQWEPNSNWREYYVGLNNAQWDNYAVEADITFKGLQPGAESYSGFGLLTRANRAGSGKQFYQFIIRTKEKKMEFMKCNNNTWTTYTTVATAALPAPGEVFRMRAENVNNSIRIYLNGILFAEIEDASYASGGIGIGYGREYISIDNVRAVQPKQFPVTLANGMVGGTIEFQPTQAASGKIIAVSIIPDPGFTYKEGSLTVNGTPLQGLSFEMPEGGAVLFCEFEEQVKAAVSSTISTLVASYAANLPVSVYNPDGQTVTVRLTAPDQSILDSKNMTQTGSYLIRIDKAIAGTYTLPAYVGDLLVSEATVNCVTPADTLWAPLMAVDGEVTTLTFGGMLSFKANEEVSVNGQKLPAIAYRLDGNQLILSRAVQEGQVIVIKGIRYPELFPSYSFTFTLTYTE